MDGNFTEHATPIARYGNIPPIVELEYAYDKDSNRTQAYDDRPGASQTLSHEYTYDGVDRLDEAKRGSWNGSAFTLGLGSQRWSLDMLGNWTTIETNEDTAYVSMAKTPSFISIGGLIMDSWIMAR